MHPLCEKLFTWAFHRVNVKHSFVVINPRNCRINPRICCLRGSRFVLMIEVFKTNVCNRCDANMLIEQIQQYFFNYQVNFDLEDCDRILRVKCITGTIQSALLINFLKNLGFDAEVLPDEIPFAGSNSIHTMTL